MVGRSKLDRVFGTIKEFGIESATNLTKRTYNQPPTYSASTLSMFPWHWPMEFGQKFEFHRGGNTISAIYSPGIMHLANP